MAARRQILLFLAATFGGAWLCWGYWVVAMPPGGLQLSAAFLICAIVGGLAPSLAALGVAFWMAGKAGVAQLLSRFRLGPVPRRIVLIAVLLMPAVTAVSAMLQAGLVGPVRFAAPDLLAMALVWPVMAALGEEIGWRGWLLPRLEAGMGLLPAALVVGVIWGVWHLPADYIALKGYGDWFWPAFLVNGPIVLTGHSLIMAWLYRESRGNLAIAVLYHFTITATAIAVPTTGAEGSSGVLAAGIGAGVVWLAAGALWWPRRRQVAY